jgi:hypothetical protein
LYIDAGNIGFVNASHAKSQQKTESTKFFIAGSVLVNWAMKLKCATNKSTQLVSANFFSKLVILKNFVHYI